MPERRSPQYQCANPPLCWVEKHPLKAFEAPRTPHKRPLCGKGCAQVHWKQDTEKMSLEAGQAHWERLLFPARRALSGAIPRVSCLTAGSPHGLSLLRLDFSTQLARIHRHGSPLWRGESASSITDTKGVNSLLYNWKGFCCEQEGVQGE